MKNQKTFLKKSLFITVLSLFIFTTILFKPVKADGFTTTESIFLAYTSTSVTMLTDSSNSNRKIGIFKIDFAENVDDLTITFDDTTGLMTGNPALLFSFAQSSLNSLVFTEMAGNTGGGIGHNLIYYNNISTSAVTTVYLHISIDSVADANYINNMTAIIGAMRIFKGDPYEFATATNYLTDAEILEMVLLARYEGYQAGLTANAESFAEDLEEEITRIHTVGFDASGYADLYSLDPDLGWDYLQGYTDGAVSTNEESYSQGYIDGGNDSFQANLGNWIVPAILIVLILGGFIAFAKMKKSE